MAIIKKLVASTTNFLADIYFTIYISIEVYQSKNDRRST